MGWEHISCEKAKSCGMAEDPPMECVKSLMAEKEFQNGGNGVNSGDFDGDFPGEKKTRLEPFFRSSTSYTCQFLTPVENC